MPVEAEERGRVRPEQPTDLLGDDVEHRLGPRRRRDCDRHTAERRTSLGERGDLLARLGVRERDGDEVRELADPLLVRLPERLVPGDRDDDRAPERAGHRDRRGDERRDPELLQPCSEARRHVGVVDAASRRATGQPDAVEGAAVERDDRADLRDRDTGLAPLPHDQPFFGLEIDEADEIRGVGTEQPRDLLGHDVEDRLGALGLRDGDRHAAERRASLCECLERLLLKLPRGDVADDRNRLVVAAPDDARLEVSQRVALPLQRVVDELDGVVLERARIAIITASEASAREDLADVHADEVVRVDRKPRGLAEAELEERAVRRDPVHAVRDRLEQRAGTALAGGERAKRQPALERDPRGVEHLVELGLVLKGRVVHDHELLADAGGDAFAVRLRELERPGRRRRRTRAGRSRGSRARGSGRGARGGARPGPPRACASPTARRRADGSSRRSGSAGARRGTRAGRGAPLRGRPS